MAESLFYACNMCSYGARDLDGLTSHVCRNHKNDPRFHIYCKSCLRSYTKWDSYRKHVQRGCNATPTSALINPGAGEITPSGTSDENDIDAVNEIDNGYEPDIVCQKDWHEALYILHIKEKYILSQSAVDHILLSTKTLVSDILNEILDDIQYTIPTNIMHLLQKKVAHINSTLFEHLSTAPMQKKYFKQYFDLVVSK